MSQLLQMGAAFPRAAVEAGTLSPSGLHFILRPNKCKNRSDLGDEQMTMKRAAQVTREPGNGTRHDSAT